MVVAAGCKSPSSLTSGPLGCIFIILVASYVSSCYSGVMLLAFHVQCLHNLLPQLCARFLPAAASVQCVAVLLYITLEHFSFNLHGTS
jgi:hypothetical protein